MNNKFIYNESINEIIKRRKSVRTYKTDEVSNETIEKLNKYIEKLNGVFNKSVIFKILDSNEHINGARLGTYGVIKGASKFIAVKINNDDESLIAVDIVSTSLENCDTYNTQKINYKIKLVIDANP